MEVDNCKNRIKLTTSLNELDSLEASSRGRELVKVLRLAENAVGKKREVAVRDHMMGGGGWGGCRGGPGKQKIKEDNQFRKNPTDEELWTRRIAP